MKCKEIIQILEELAPISYAEDWDNVGLLVGDPQKDVYKIMIALDVTNDVLEQGIEEKIDLLITHHPMIFSPLKRIRKDDFIGGKVTSLIQHDISYYAMHTNFDATVLAEQGAKLIGLEGITVLEKNQQNEKVGIGRLGYLKNPLTLRECAELIKEKFSLEHIRLVGKEEQLISYVAISPGSGKSMIQSAIQAGAEVLITGDIDHHNGIDANEQGLCIIDGGHFGTEHMMVNYVKEYLMKQLQSIEIISASEVSPFIVI